MANNELYKLFQLVDVFVTKYEYTQLVLKHYQQLSDSEVWLFNNKASNYHAIRITYNSASAFIYDNNRVEEYLAYFKKAIGNQELRFLDIHISKDEYNPEYEPFDYLNIEENYSSGVDVKQIYPDIYSAIHYVDNPSKEISGIVTKIRKSINRRVSSFKNQSKTTYIVTYIFMAICIVNYLLGLFLKYKYDDSSSIYVVLGADYKTFTLGLKQFYRLITYSFVHSDIFHIFCNLYSLNFLGKYAEIKYGHFKYSLIMIFSILCGSLTQGILSDNGICLGLSAGIYGLLVIFIIDTVSSGFINLRALIPTIVINIGINFLSTTAWMAHLGGAIGGLAIYYYLKEQKVQRLILCIVLLLCLTYKYVTIDEIKDLYLGTDMNVIQIYNDLGFKNYANSILKKLINFYTKFGG